MFVGFGSFLLMGFAILVGIFFGLALLAIIVVKVLIVVAGLLSMVLGYFLNLNEGEATILGLGIFGFAVIAGVITLGVMHGQGTSKPDENYEMNLAIEQSKVPPTPQWQFIVEDNGTSRVRIKLHGTPSYEGSSVSCSLWARNLSPYTNRWAEMYNRYEDTTYDGGWLTLPIADFRTFLGKRGMEPGSYPASCTIGIAPRLERAHGPQTLARFGVGTITYSRQEPQTVK